MSDEWKKLQVDEMWKRLHLRTNVEQPTKRANMLGCLLIRHIESTSAPDRVDGDRREWGIDPDDIVTTVETLARIAMGAAGKVARDEHRHYEIAASPLMLIAARAIVLLRAGGPENVFEHLWPDGCYLELEGHFGGDDAKPTVTGHA